MKNSMKISAFILFLLMIGTSYQSKSSVFGEAEWVPMVVQVACTMNPNEYAHYRGLEKTCVGWGGLCDGEGTLQITDFDPIHPCPPY